MLHALQFNSCRTVRCGLQFFVAMLVDELAAVSSVVLSGGWSQPIVFSTG